MPQKTVKAYKLFRVNPKNPTQLFPLFVDATTPVPMHQWVDAVAGEFAPDGKKVKSRIGRLAYRPGWHGGDLPIATHIGGKSKGTSQTKPDTRRPHEIWAEVEMAADFDWQTEANSRAKITKGGNLYHQSAHITDQVPYSGYYRYKTNSNQLGEWMISGQMRVNRILSDQEVKKINKVAGVADLRRRKPQISLQIEDAMTMPTADGSRIDAEHGHVPPIKQRITKDLAKKLNMPANMVGKVAFPMAADRLMVGYHTSRSGRVFELRGGVEHPELDIHQGVVGWATMGTGGVAKQLLKAIDVTDGVGLVYLMQEEACASNRSFARVAVEEMRHDMATVKGAEEIFQKYLNIGVQGLKKWASGQDKPDAAIMSLEVFDIEQLDQLLPQMSFDQRKNFLPKIMSNNYKKEINAKLGLSPKSMEGALSWVDLYKQLNDDKYSPQNGYQAGDIVKVIQFDQANPTINIVEELGITPDPTYDVSFRGNSVSGTINGQVSVYDVFKHTLDYFAYDMENMKADPKWNPNPERTLRPDRSIGSSANRVLQLRGLKHGRVKLAEDTLIPREQEVNFKRETKAQEGYFQDRTRNNQEIRKQKLGSSYL